jgi:hypothetical protein
VEHTGRENEVKEPNFSLNKLLSRVSSPLKCICAMRCGRNDCFDAHASSSSFQQLLCTFCLLLLCQNFRAGLKQYFFCETSIVTSLAVILYIRTLNVLNQLWLQVFSRRFTRCEENCIG